MNISEKQLKQLADIIVFNLKKEFFVNHLSKNLINTIKVVQESDKIQIIIPADVYNMKLYQTKGVIQKTYKGSYASKIDTKGSEFIKYDKNGKGHWVRPHHHKGYIDKVVNESLEQWLKSNQGLIEKKNIIKE